MRTGIFLLTFFCATGSIAADIAKLSVSHTRPHDILNVLRHQPNQVTYSMQATKQDLNHVWMTAYLVSRDPLGLETQAQCELRINGKRSDSTDFAVYSDGSLNFYLERLGARDRITFSIKWRDPSIKIVTSAIQISSDEGKQHMIKRRYYRKKDSRLVSIILDDNNNCRFR